jgi:hypothetical protein
MMPQTDDSSPMVVDDEPDVKEVKACDRDDEEVGAGTQLDRLPEGATA